MFVSTMQQPVLNLVNVSILCCRSKVVELDQPTPDKSL